MERLDEGVISVEIRNPEKVTSVGATVEIHVDNDGLEYRIVNWGTQSRD